MSDTNRRQHQTAVSTLCVDKAAATRHDRIHRKAALLSALAAQLTAGRNCMHDRRTCKLPARPKVLRIRLYSHEGFSDMHCEDYFPLFPCRAAALRQERLIERLKTSVKAWGERALSVCGRVLIPNNFGLPHLVRNPSFRLIAAITSLCRPLILALQAAPCRLCMRLHTPQGERLGSASGGHAGALSAH